MAKLLGVAVWHSTILHYTIMYCTVLYCTWCGNVLYYTVLYCTAPGGEAGVALLLHHVLAHHLRVPRPGAALPDLSQYFTSKTPIDMHNIVL